MTLWRGRMRDLDAYLRRHVMRLSVRNGKAIVLEFVWILGYGICSIDGK